VGVVERGLLAAEEMYLVEPGASLGTWFARVQETICVACRVTVGRLEDGRQLREVDLAGEQLGLLADVCAEAIRAAAQIWPGGPSPEARGEVLALVAERAAPAAARTIPDVLILLACCTAALEPLANGLREGDLPMADPLDRAVIEECFLVAAGHAFAGVYALC
jgi:hypothetical protein